MRYPIPGFLMFLLLINCIREKDGPFGITRDRVGKLQRNEQVSDINRIYKNDSIVRDTTQFQLGRKSRNIRIFEKGGNILLTLTPSEDSIPRIVNIRIHDPRFTTENGIGLKSTFGEIKDAYAISKIVTSMNNVIIFIHNSDVYFTISKEELPASLRYVGSTNIEATQIPDKARVKYMMVSWE